MITHLSHTHTHTHTHIGLTYSCWMVSALDTNSALCHCLDFSDSLEPTNMLDLKAIMWLEGYLQVE